MTVRKSIWLALLVAGIVVVVLAEMLRGELGCIGGFALAVAILAAAVLMGIGTVALFRAIVRRLALRLAFSYFLIGIVPIPLLALLLLVGAYLVAHQVVATRVHSQATALVGEWILTGTNVRTVEARQGEIVRSDLPWLPRGAKIDWKHAVETPRPILAGTDVWFVSAKEVGDSCELRLIPLTDKAFLQALADRTGYSISIETGRGRRRGAAYEIGPDKRRKRDRKVERPTVHPSNGSRSSDDWIHQEWIAAVYVEPALGSFGAPESEENLVVFLARTSPATLFAQLFAQGVPEIGQVFWVVTAGLAGALLFVYLVALSIAFVLVGSIARNVNRLTRATQEIARGDFSARVNSRSRDQIGDLARSFDGMAASIQRLLVQTAEKERLEGEIAVARTIQQKLLPNPEATFPGVSVLAHFHPVADIGGDYYDYLPMPDGRIAVAIGDVSGHGLPTGLLAAMAKAALSTLIESGLSGTPLFVRLNDLIYRSTDSRNYMTLALFAYDPLRREVELSNAGQLAPYRISEDRLESLSLPSFPLGASPRSDFPTHAYSFAAGDRLLFVTDGFIEATNASGEPFGFERLEQLLRSEAGADAVRLREALLSAIAAYTGGAPPEDDRTLVILTFT